jgi:hypothetical protein
MVFLAAFIVFFSQEIGNSIQKIFSNNVVRIVLSLALASLFIQYYELDLNWLIILIKSQIHRFIHWLVITTDAKESWYDYYLALLLFLIPFSDLVAKRIKKTVIKTTLYKIRFSFPILITWIFFSILLTLQLPG